MQASSTGGDECLGLLQRVAVHRLGRELSATQAKTVLSELLAHGGDPKEIAATLGFERLSSESLAGTVAALIEQFPDEWMRYREGDEKLAQFFIGQVMKATKGQANGKSVIEQLQARR